MSILDRNHIKGFTLRVISITVDLVANERYEEEMANAKCLILDGVKDHVVPHISKKEMEKEM